ncbi:hypothetical protein M8J75_010986 [Diaphorina citri]|nr:hypothetical protein M8J75_010986 [Diaphorina citri]KAI5747545.1 hypothetical protein M8J77_015838 [Diaphorina citri]
MGLLDAKDLIVIFGGNLIDTSEAVDTLDEIDHYIKIKVVAIMSIDIQDHALGSIVNDQCCGKRGHHSYKE